MNICPGNYSCVCPSEPDWFEEIIAGYAHDNEAQDVPSALANDSEAKPLLSLDHGLIRHNGKIWIENNQQMQARVSAAFHSSTLGGHSCAPMTYKRIKTLFCWTGMKNQITTWVQSCQICQQAKPEKVKYPGLLEPLRVPKRPWQHIVMDFIKGLPQSGQYNCILVIVDRFSRFAHSNPLSHPYTVAKVASLFVDQVYKLHSLPESILFDRDPIFTSHF